MKDVINLKKYNRLICIWLMTFYQIRNLQSCIFKINMAFINTYVVRVCSKIIQVIVVVRHYLINKHQLKIVLCAKKNV
jgi:hypothetical protein